MSFNQNFKDSYVKLSAEAVFLDADTVLETENSVIQKTLASLLTGKKSNSYLKMD